MWDKITRFAGEVFGKGEEDPAVTRRKDEIESVTGVRPNIIDPTTNPIADAIHTGYSNLINRPEKPAGAITPLNTMVMPGYKPGKEPHVETHEVGHLSNEQAGLPKFLGASGRLVGRGISDNIGKPAPLELLSGALLITQDAEEEDRAERFTAKYGSKLGTPEHLLPTIDSEGGSAYGNNLRREGTQRILGTIEPILNTIRKVNQWNTQRKQNELQPQIREAVLNHRRISAASDDITPELINSSNNLSKLEDKYGDGYLDFIDTIQ